MGKLKKNIIEFWNKNYEEIIDSIVKNQQNDKRNKSLKKFLDITIVQEIHHLLQGNESIAFIADKYGVSDVTIRNINNGSCKKYILNGYIYPIRKLSKR